MGAITEREITEIKTLLEGCEISSLTYEGVVYVSNGVAYTQGEKLKSPDWSILWKEYIASELTSWDYYTG